MTMTKPDPFYEWVLELGPIYPVRPSTYGADPYRPDPHQDSRYEMQAALRGGWHKAGSRKERRRKRRKR